MEAAASVVADASHELKTPLTVIMTNAELMSDPEYSEAYKAQFLSHILVMSRQMRELIEQLLELARTDNAESRPTVGTVDFSRLAANAVLPFEPAFFEKGCAWTSGSTGIFLFPGKRHCCSG